MSSVTGGILRAGLRRGIIEYRNVLQTPSEVGYTLFGLGVVVAVLWFLRDATLDGSELPIVLFSFPGILAMQVVFAGAYGAATVLTTEREDGTLLRMKTLPHGMGGYVIGVVVRILLEVIMALVIVIIPASFLIPGLWSQGPGGALAALGFVALGVLAIVPIGVTLGSLFRNPRSVAGWGLLVMGGFIAISGIFAPLTLFPAWLQVVAQVFPLYWLGLGLRGALLPDAMAVVEVAESWRVLETVGVLGAWAILGLVLAPALLRRAARRESGSAIERRRDAALQRV